MNLWKDINAADEVIKHAIIDAIAKDLKGYITVECITDELTKMQQEKLISSELFEWAITEAEKEHKQKMLEVRNVDCDTFLKKSLPVKLGNDDLYHASLCSTVVNKSSDTEQCKKLLQSLSYKSLKELSVSQSDNNITFPRCMIAVSSDSSNVTTCYVAFQNIPEFKMWEVLGDVQKSTFGKGIRINTYLIFILIRLY